MTALGCWLNAQPGALPPLVSYLATAACLAATKPKRTTRIAAGLDLARFQVVVVAVNFGDVGGAGQDGLPMLGVGDAQLLEDAGGVVEVALLHPRYILSRGHQVEGDRFGQSLRFDGENDVFEAPTYFFQLTADVQFGVLIDLFHSHVKHISTQVDKLFHFLVAFIINRTYAPTGSSAGMVGFCRSWRR